MASPREETRHVLGAADAFPPGTSTVVDVGGRSIGVFNDDGRLAALRNVCPHHGAQLCQGDVMGTMLPCPPHEYVYSGADPDHRVIRCPWHGYEFRLADGRSIVDPDRMRVRSYRVEVEDGQLVVYV